MSLGSEQRKFTRMIACLIIYVYDELGHELTFGDAYRAPSVHGEVGEKKSYSSAMSLHKDRLAVDFNLFVGGKYITAGEHPEYIKIGEFWERLGGAWGGRFNDANHFSKEYQGRK